MKTLRLLVALSVFALPSAGFGGVPDLLISEIVDGTLPGGQPKFVELSNCGAEPVDLSGFSIGNFNNGGDTLGGGSSSALNPMVLPPGGSYVLAYESAPDKGLTSVFEDTYGFAPDQFIGPFINGDDVIALFVGPATGDGSDAVLHDIYGVVGVDGTDEAWEYTDSYAQRRPGASPSATFDASQWTIPGPNSLETGDDAEETELLRTRTNPGRHACDPVPVPLHSAVGLAALLAAFLAAGSLLLLRRRPAQFSAA